MTHFNMMPSEGLIEIWFKWEDNSTQALPLRARQYKTSLITLQFVSAKIESLRRAIWSDGC